MLVTIGVDVARDGTDHSTVYVRYGNTVWCHGEFRFSSDVGGTEACADEVVRLCLSLIQSGSRYPTPLDAPVDEIHVRVDTTGLGGGVADSLRGRGGESVRALLGDEAFRVFDVIFGSTNVRDPMQYHDVVTELYAVAGEVLHQLTLVRPDASLEQDLTGRQWNTAFRDGQAIKQIEPKDRFKSRYQRSPDHGDGCVLAIVPPETLGVVREISYVVTPAILRTRTMPDWEWGQVETYPPLRHLCAGVDGYLATDGNIRLHAVIRGMLPDGRHADVWVAYLFGENPWKQLAHLLVRHGVPWCVVQAHKDMWEPALSFATTMRDVPEPPKCGHFRRVYLARWVGSEPRPTWRDKPTREVKLKGEETGYKYVVDMQPVGVIRASLDRWRDGGNVCPPLGDLFAELPCDASGVPEMCLRAGWRGAMEVKDAALGSAYQTHLTRTGFRRGNGTIQLVDPFGGGFAAAGALADVGVERMAGG